MKNGFSLAFVTSGIDVDGKTIELKVSLKPIEMILKQNGLVKLLETLKDFLSIPYFSRKKPVNFLKKRILIMLETWKPQKIQPPKEVKNEMPGFQKINLEDINKEKQLLEHTDMVIDQNYKKYDLKDHEVAQKEKISKVLYQELLVLRAKAHKTMMKEKLLDLKTNLKRIGLFALIDFREIDIKLERNQKKSPLVMNFSLPNGKIQAVFNQPQNESNFIMFNGLKIDFSKDLDYIFDLLLKLV